MLLWNTLVQLFFPRRCPVCDRIAVPFGEKICTECIPKLRPVGAPWCIKCGRRLPGEGKYCAECGGGDGALVREHAYQRGRSVFEYAGAAPALYRFKYAGRREYADYFGEETVYYLGDFLRETGAEALIPVPLHRKRMRKRGYNQAADYARAISRYSGIPTRTDILRRVRNTVPMKRLGPQERQNNLKKAFIVRRNDVKLNSVVLVDDIYTTGTTIDEAARTLREAGVDRIYFVALAAGNGV